MVLQYCISYYNISTTLYYNIWYCFNTISPCNCLLLVYCMAQGPVLNFDLVYPYGLLSSFLLPSLPHFPSLPLPLSSPPPPPPPSPSPLPLSSPPPTAAHSAIPDPHPLHCPLALGLPRHCSRRGLPQVGLPPGVQRRGLQALPRGAQALLCRVYLHMHTVCMYVYIYVY